ncbi:MAG: hypothetical protein OXI63_11585 [Candidatus Poribacteria bacterium]|nr:hypothetical protein [Candidatus Poribacteria bacterium]
MITLSNVQVGAVHLNQSGYTEVRLQGTGGSLDTTYDLDDGWNLLTFPNVILTRITMTFTGTGTLSAAAVFLTDIDLTSESLRHRPRTYTPKFTMPEGGIFRPARTVVSQHAFEWRYLPWEKVDILEGIFDRHGALGNPELTLIPDGYEAERYQVVIASPFDFYPSVDGYFDGGASGAMIFETV